MKRFGLLGGMSYESTIKYYELILQKYYDKFNDYNFPEIVVFSLNFQKVINYESSKNRDKYIEYLMVGINSLEQAGASFVIMAANSPHAVYEDLTKLSKVPILSIVQTTIEKAQKEKLQNLLLLGIKFTMQSTFYQDFGREKGINIIVPSNEQQDEINEIIFNELVIGFFREESKSKIIRIIKQFEVDGVILGCTELSLILTQNDIEIRVLDTLRLHVDAALDYYFSSE